MGMVDYFRLPKRQWYWYRNEYRNIPPPAWPQGGTPAGLLLTTDKPFLKAVDGTEDAQIIVTVVDRNGTHLSNSPPVTLTIQSGPGEFPTGREISFDPRSDIAIRDGQAAMEFRSYRLANDGDEKTFWSANNSEPGAWWEVDLERLCVIKGASLTFPDAGNYRFKITTSVDGQQWHPATDESETSDTNQTRNEAFAPGSSGRYVRITFTGLPQDTPARLSEVQIRGNIVPQ
jgi:hypothetical protein